MKRLYITNGDRASDRMREVFGYEYILPWRDVLHEGPVRSCASLMEQSMERAKFISTFAQQDFLSVLNDFQKRDEILLKGEFDEIHLWFEHDLYDQLQLLQILDILNKERPDIPVKLVQTDDYLSELSSEAFAQLPDLAEKLVSEHFEYASKIWREFRSSSHEKLGELLHEQGALPCVVLAMKRVLKEHPDEQTGLPLSMKYALEPLLSAEAKMVDLFKAMMKAEDAKFMGDLGFAQQVNDLIIAQKPLLQAKAFDHEHYQEFFAQKVSLTSWGQKVLKGEARHLYRKDKERWLGGVQII